jgi:hypothetical protein
MSIALLFTSKETGVELNAETINRMFMSCEQNTGENKNKNRETTPFKLSQN